MARCRSCNKQISRLDKDYCPYCGAPNPISATYETQDMTKEFGFSFANESLAKTKSHHAYGLLCMFLGYFGIHEFYVGKPRRGIIEILITLFIVGGIGSIVFFLAWPNVFAYLIPFFAIWVIDVIWGIFLYRANSIKDGKGELLR